MSKTKKIVIGIISGVVGLILIAYLGLCIISEKPGMDGFTVTNNMFRMLITGEDYVKVGEDRYLYRGGALGKIIENEYDSYTYTDECVKVWEYNNYELPRLEDFYALDSEPPYHNESELLKASLVLKDGEVLKGGGVHVWSPLVDAYSVYYRPYDGNFFGH